MTKFILSHSTLAKGIVASGLAAYAAFPAQTEIATLGLGGIGTVVAGYCVTNWLVELPHRFRWIRPLHRALHGPLGLPADVKPTSYIKISRRYETREDVGKILLPAEFTGMDEKTPTHVIKAKLGLTDASVSYRLAGRKPHLVIRQTPRPPARVTFADWQEQVEKSAESAPLIGIGPQSRHVKVDLDAESPHILVSASTGGGKSVITRAMSCQMLHNGAQMVVLDFKRHSHRWARGLASVDYRREVAEIHDALVELGREGHRRNKVVDDWEGETDPDVGPRMVVLLEEANATIAKLKRYWSAVRKSRGDEDGPADPKESPAIDALREILFMGRAVKMHVLLVAQSATAAALGGPEVRECFATRILARYTVNAWRMLVPEVAPIPRSTRHVGRAQVVLGGVATETQVLFFSDLEAREWASTGVLAPPPSLSRDNRAPFPTRENGRDSHAGVTPDLVLIQGGRTYNLAEAAREGIVPMSADALRQAKRRDASFPPGDNGRWTAEELRNWHAARSA